MSRACPARRIISVSLMSARGCPPIAPRWGACCLSGLAPERTGRIPRPGGYRAAHAEDDHRPRRALAGRSRKAEAEGFAIVDEELELGLRSIAVPIRDRQARTVAAINVSTQSAASPSQRWTREILPAAEGQAARRGFLL